MRVSFLIILSLILITKVILSKKAFGQESSYAFKFYNECESISPNKVKDLKFSKLETIIIYEDVKLEDFQLCLLHVNPNNDLDINKNINFLKERSGRGRFLANLNLINQIKSISYNIESETKNGTNFFELRFEFREDKSILAFGFDYQDYCALDERFLCAWDGDKKEFDIKYEPFNMAYIELVDNVLNRLFNSFNRAMPEAPMRYMKIYSY
mgnify:FL=1|tara:strand:- start:10429 stop:11061 length:633 start_codon:yes stop_codon:yes gene_type:complete